MKHIKICKPKMFTNKTSIKEKEKDFGASKTSRAVVIQTQGLGCVPTGNIIDRD